MDLFANPATNFQTGAGCGGIEHGILDVVVAQVAADAGITPRFIPASTVQVTG